MNRPSASPAPGPDAEPPVDLSRRHVLAATGLSALSFASAACQPTAAAGTPGAAGATGDPAVAAPQAPGGTASPTGSSSPAPATRQGSDADDPAGAMTTGDILAEKLIAWKVRFVYGIPGDGINPIIEALRKRQDRIKFVQVRHEESAAFMAAAHAKYTGELGVCLATTGPGAVHLTNGLYDAKLEGAPVLAITGSTFHDMGGTHHPQDVNVVSLFQDVALYNEHVLGPIQAMTVVDLACRAALSERGVAHLTIPIDVQAQALRDDRPSHLKGKSRAVSTFLPVSHEVPSDEQLDAAAKALNAGRRTAILVGRGALGARPEIEQLADTLGAPVMKALLGKGVLPDDSPFTTRTTGHLGTLPSQHAVERCDTFLIIGSTMPYLEYYPKTGQARVVQLDRDPSRLGLRCPVDVGLVGDSKLTLQKLLPRLEKRADRSFLDEARRGMHDWDELLTKMETSDRVPLRPPVIARALGDLLKDDALLSIDCGAHTVFTARHLRMRGSQFLAMAGNHTTMGPGLPYAIAAQLAFPGRQVVACVGDGGFTMLMAEFLTAVKYRLPITVVVFKNNWLGHVIYEQLDEGYQEFGLELQPLDFVKYAEACGGVGFRCERPEQVKPALEAALRSGRPAIVEAVVGSHDNPAPPDKYSL